MVAPVITWWNATDTSQYSSYSWGTVDAGSISSDNTFNIWNDKGGSAGSSTATSVTFTAKDSAGGDTGELVTGKWTEVKCTSYGDTTFTAVGGTTVKEIGYSTGVQTIPSNQKAVCVVHINVPSNATAGTVNFKLRVSYTYV
jgi:hypothetical protein